MKKLRFVISLTTDDNDYQQEQARCAKEAAQRLGVELDIIHAGNDAITQSQQLLKVIQSPSGPRPDGIVFEPVGGTAFPQVARASAAAGIAWAVLNREAEYLSELRKTYKIPVFALTSDHLEIGRIQGRQFNALLPTGGTVLYIQGPSGSLAAQQRAAGMYETKLPEIQVRVLKAQWTEASSYQSVSSWLRLRTSHETRINVVSGQDDSMAMGARKAFQEIANQSERERWLALPFTGCDGLPETGQAWVRSGLLAATVVVPANTGQALEMLVRSAQTGAMPPEQTLTVPSSYPELKQIAARKTEKSRSAFV